MRKIKKVMGLVLTVMLSLSCIMSVYGDDDVIDITDIEEEQITLGGEASTYSSYVISSMSAAVGTSSYSGSARMLTSASGTISIYLMKKQSDGTYKIVDSATKGFYGVRLVVLSDSYDFTKNPGTYKCQTDCKAHGAIYHYETSTCVTLPVTR